MVSVVMKSKVEKPTRLAVKIATLLLCNTKTTPDDFVCMSTGETIIGRCNYHVMLTINANAQGPYYLAYGYYYILCNWSQTNTYYVAVHNARDTKLVGWMKNVYEFEAFVNEKAGS